MITEEEARKWIGKSVDLMFTEYTLHDPEPLYGEVFDPDIVSAIGVTGILKRIVKDGGKTWLILTDDGFGEVGEDLDEIVAIEDGTEVKRK